jgi:hypothetical protein
LEQTATNSQQPEFVPNPNSEDVNLEHIIPVNRGDKWKHLTEDECKSLHRRLGNLALLPANINTTAANAGFPEKKKLLSESGYRLTKEIAKESSWTTEQVHKRQQTLANIAVKTWSGKFS